MIASWSSATTEAPRVAHRMALDHPRAVGKAAVLDILPTLTLYEETDAAFATAYWEWFFFIQGYDFPRR
jgi:haloacetate dehalogenase